MVLNLKRVASDRGDLADQIDREPDLLIDIADWIVRDGFAWAANPDRAEPESSLQNRQALIERAQKTVRGQLKPLESILFEGHSAWTVDLDVEMLTLRVSAEERETFGQAIQDDDDVSTYLRDGWSAAWGVKPDGDKACDNAIKALEAAFRLIVSPKDPSASLGKIAKTLKQKPSKWVARFESALQTDSPHDGSFDPVVALADQLQMVLQTHHRHASEGAEGNTVEEGRDAITLAVALVALQRRGYLSRRETV